MLAEQFDEVAQRDRHTRDFTLRGLRNVLRELIACFPVYRTYITAAANVSDADRRAIDAAVTEAIYRNPSTGAVVFDFVGRTILSQPTLAGRFQQLTAPVTAKGVEDTAFYVYNRLVSLNEVGGDPGRFGTSPEALHAYLGDRQENWSLALSPLSTHDTKRSEDVRARINVLSEIPDEWRQRVQQWRQLSAPHLADINGCPAPDANDEYLLYQTLIGAWVGHDDANFVQRIKAYMTKAMREAKVHTSWTNPADDYEAAMHRFIDAILSSRVFLDDFRPFQQRVSRIGVINSLAQTLLRLTAPGVPDTYQGTELFDFSLVDPDNRRAVDYELRQRLLASTAKDVIDAVGDDAIKMRMIALVLDCRRDRPGLFSDGAYVPISVDGERRANVFAFARRLGDELAIVAVPRLVAQFTPSGGLPLADVWGDTRLLLPPAIQALAPTLRDRFTGQPFDAGARVSSLFGKFGKFPVSLCLGGRVP
jgi:(1->4)-alpha-D-glucan 1-alpha-D-glucosylmutase